MTSASTPDRYSEIIVHPEYGYLLVVRCQHCASEGVVRLMGDEQGTIGTIEDHAIERISAQHPQHSGLVINGQLD